MLSKIITKVNERILRHLIDQKASLTEIATATKTTKANISRSLKILEKEDLIRKEIKGKTHIYRFNYFHRYANTILKLFLDDIKKKYDQKLCYKPALLNGLLKQMLNDNYVGVIFFGSSINRNFNDIDIFILLKKTDGSKALIERIKKIDFRFSPIIGTLQEIENGLSHEDMLFKNITNGLPYSCEQEVIYLKYRSFFLKKQDIEERFIIGYREILSCLEFSEKEYLKRHLEKGIRDIMYAAMNYKDLSPKDDRELDVMFKKSYKMKLPDKVNKALQFAEKIGGSIL
ncbi:winged helix-turn-helix transcriptional regulator [Candidatus Woesearchaeota archaeon]|nr:winged helix-turn-helix transcriptional regulator [Candidatus Woesearchaeota archaeon]